MAMRYIQRCKQRQSDIHKDVNKGIDWYTKMQTMSDIQRYKQRMRYIQRCKQKYIQCKQRKWDIYKDVNKGNEIYTKM